MSNQISDKAKQAANNKKENLARFGIATKGVVYCLIGGLTLMAALGEGGKKTDSSGVIHFIVQQPFGKVLLAITVLGLIGFIFWRLYQAIADPEDKGSDAKGIAQRLGYASSGVFYGFLAFAAIKVLIGSSSSDGGGGNESIAATLLEQSFGQILVGIMAAIFAGKAIYQLIRAYSGKFKKKVKEAKLGEKGRKLVLISGVSGYTARGVVLGIISFLTLKAAITASSSQAGGTKDAFSFLQNEFGTIALLLVSVGLVAYGVFMFIKARYREMSLY